MARGKSTATPKSDARLYLNKAQQFLRESAVALEAQRYDACLLNAIHAAISASDAATVALAGRRSTSPDHQRAAEMLEEVAGAAPDIRTRVRQLRALLSIKNAAEYESRPARAGDARDAWERASRLVEWAAEIVGDARL
jgi:HEPN domain-containing protein